MRTVTQARIVFTILLLCQASLGVLAWFVVEHAWAGPLIYIVSVIVVFCGLAVEKITRARARAVAFHSPGAEKITGGAH